VPFTFAHPAAALPLLRPLSHYGSLSALVIGSIAPDLAFIVPVEATREQTHGLAGLLLFCLPAGGATYLLFHLLLKTPLVGLFPQQLQEKLAVPAERSLAPWRAVLVSLLCGAATHLVWDSFTHPGTVVVDALPALQALVMTVGGYHVFGYKILQHASSLAGLAMVALWAAGWMKAAPRGRVPAPALTPIMRRLCLGFVTAGPLLLAFWLGAQRSPAIGDLAGLRTFAAAFIFTLLPALAASVTAYSFAWRVWARRKRRLGAR